MALPNRAFYTVPEAAARWGCAPADVAGWAAKGLLEMVTSVPMAWTDHGHVAGLVQVAASDILPLFRRDGSLPTDFRVKRVKPREGEAAGEWVMVETPAGLPLAFSDLMIEGAHVERFEEEHELMRKGRSYSTGPANKYDWDGMYIAICSRVFEHGLPESQTALVNEMQEWFIRRSQNGDAPDESSIRRRVTPLWRELQKRAA